MNRTEFLQTQIERAKRFAATLTNIDDRERFQRAADDYQHEIDALSAADTTSRHVRTIGCNRREK
jgi:hypothetical protein